MNREGFTENMARLKILYLHAVLHGPDRDRCIPAYLNLIQ